MLNHLRLLAVSTVLGILTAAALVPVGEITYLVGYTVPATIAFFGLGLTVTHLVKRRPVPNQPHS